AFCLRETTNVPVSGARPEWTTPALDAGRAAHERRDEFEQETHMTMTRRDCVAALAAAGLGTLAGGARPQGAALKISHHVPGGPANEGDFRDRLCRRFAAEIEKRSNGALKAQVYPGSSLMKTNAQFSAMRKGALDISLYPLPYAGGEVAETNIG